MGRNTTATIRNEMITQRGVRIGCHAFKRCWKNGLSALIKTQSTTTSIGNGPAPSVAWTCTGTGHSHDKPSRLTQAAVLPLTIDRRHGRRPIRRNGRPPTFHPHCTATAQYQRESAIAWGRVASATPSSTSVPRQNNNRRKHTPQREKPSRNRRHR